MPMLRDDDSERSSSADGASESQYADSAPIPIQTPPGRARWFNRRLSEESMRTELCEGPVPDSPPKPPSPQRHVSRAVSDRAELIERLKRGESPTWITNRRVHHDCQSQSPYPWPAEQRPESLFPQRKTTSPPRTPRPKGEASPGLLPAPTITPERQNSSQGQQGMDPFQEEGVDLERPRSALHSGNFTPVKMSLGTADTENPTCPGGGGHPRPVPAGWMATSPPGAYTPLSFMKETASYRREAFKSCSPSSLSSSLSSSFVYKPPTSPLVQSEINEELDLTLPLDSFNIDANSSRDARRHTLNLSYLPPVNAASHRQSPLRREDTHPYQAHQPRRSLNSTPNFLTGTSPQTPAVFRSRRPSFSSEASPLHHASMVGSYEESILRGRMSTTPSKPLEFMAQIGVLGLGKCKASLRCPRHVTLPFSAVFYSYADSSKGAEDGPSPYVGQIDLENGLPNLEDGQRARKKFQSRFQARNGVGEADPPAHDSSVELSDGEGGPKPSKSKRRSRSPKAPPGGGYRIPEKGQLQLVIKNQNKTAVKLFLVPYDLAGMEPGTKTFIRQRSYSAGPIVEADIAGNKDHPMAADRPILRYLIHLHICCLSKGRFYLYKFIRVVFANRVPDGKEKLRNEVTYPDPRFTPYKPGRVTYRPLGPNNHHAAATASSLSPGAPLAAADRSFRRRSAGFSFPNGHHPHSYHHFPQFHTLEEHRNRPPSAALVLQPRIANVRQGAEGEAEGEAEIEEDLESEQQDQDTATTTTPPTPMAMPGVEMTGRSTISFTTTTTTGSFPGLPHTTATTNTLGDQNNTTSLGAYDKLTKGDVGYGGNTFAASGSADGRHTSAEGLLSKRLRSLGVVQQQPSPGLGERGDCADGATD
ncbi:hypothetical protein C8A03DRAFT_36263 [Achaetomium macrosporum]|uniref:Atos-like conserved domain-containing protein n=1 Tax=Achaetomium macrosporum TaxID=79813 RepID=A0AAN7H5F0_9PEZI|nr:hypothetical protein C8A03DRAFT_36263 [Achaetomium macrosporum]